jgi:hypothetical protein
MAESGTDPDDVDEGTGTGDEDDVEGAIAAGGSSTELPESVPDAYQQAADDAAAVRGDGDG